jgi:hypothetical protein
MGCEGMGVSLFSPTMVLAGTPTPTQKPDLLIENDNLEYDGPPESAGES